MFIADTNIWLELLLGKEKAKQVIQMLQIIPLNNLYISDFSLHSIGVILDRHNKHQEFNDFINDILIKGKTKLIKLSATEFKKLLFYYKKLALISMMPIKLLQCKIMIYN